MVDDELINEIDTVISIVKMGRSARNKANLKIRQPLQSIDVYADKELVESALNNKGQILEELNIKNLKICKNREDLVNFNVKPNYSTLSSKVGSDMKVVIEELKKIDFDQLMDSFKSKGSYELSIEEGAVQINQEDIIVDEIPLENFSVSTNQNMVAGVSTLITPELYNEGLIRDLIRHIQNLRKDSDLSVDDRIDLVIKYEDESLAVAIKDHEKYLLNEVLGVEIKNDINSMDYSNSLKINNKEVTIGVKVNNKV